MAQADGLSEPSVGFDGPAELPVDRSHCPLLDGTLSNRQGCYRCSILFDRVSSHPIVGGTFNSNNLFKLFAFHCHYGVINYHLNN